MAFLDAYLHELTVVAESLGYGRGNDRALPHSPKQLPRHERLDHTPSRWTFG